MQSCDIFHTQHAIFFATFDTCTGTMWFGHHKVLHVLFLFSLYAHASYFLYAIYYFYFIQRCLDEFCLKCYRNTSCQSLLVINSLFGKISRVCVRIDFIVFNRWVWVEWFMTSLIFHLFAVVLSWIAKGGDC